MLACLLAFLIRPILLGSWDNVFSPTHKGRRSWASFLKIGQGVWARGFILACFFYLCTQAISLDWYLMKDVNPLTRLTPICALRFNELDLSNKCCE